MYFILWLLFPFEFLYIIGFKLVIAYKSFRGNRSFPQFKVIAVGNLTMGGTGKSVVVPFLANLIGFQKSAIVLRGYKGQVEHSGRSVLVSDGHQIFVTKEQSGDEAMMYGLEGNACVVVGKNRAQSLELLEDIQLQHQKKITHVLLDDAYQNHAVKKDLEILLLDARAPLGNGHCLPLGSLREKDYTRADIIILTHADRITHQHREHIKQHLLSKMPPACIFTGRHAPAGVFHLNKTKVPANQLAQKKFLLVAGVGSFQGVIHTVQSAGVSIVASKEFRDHHEYVQADLDELLGIMKREHCDGIVTTAKDWVKLQGLLSTLPDLQKSLFYVVRVTFEFLSVQEYDDFLKVMKEKIF